MFHIFYNSLERVYIFLVHRLHAQHHVTVHLYETAVGVPCKAGVARLANQPFHHFIVQAEVKNRIHHARHGSACARTDGHQQRVFHIAEFGAHQCLHVRDGVFHFLFQQGNDFFLPHFIIFCANFCRDCEARRNRNSDKVHLCQVGSLTPQKVSHAGFSFCLAVTKGVNSFFVHNINLKFLIVIFSFFLLANLSIFHRLENFLRKNFKSKCNFEIAKFNIPIHREKLRKNTYFCR